MAENVTSDRTMPRGLRQRVGLLYVVLITANVAAWLWAYSLFAGQPALLSTALLAYVFGLRQRLGLSRIEASARARFERASELARQAAVA